MKLSTVFRHAARLVEQGVVTYSCTAVTWASAQLGYCPSEYPRRAYQCLISPRAEGYLSPSDFEPWRYCNPRALALARNHRVLALCMAAVLADEEGA